jgi:hypothetical protein
MTEFQIKQFPAGKIAENGVLRRNCQYLYSPAERAIWDAKEAVEKYGAHPLLTEAINLLKAAQCKVADYVELCPTCNGSQHVKATSPKKAMAWEEPCPACANK